MEQLHIGEFTLTWLNGGNNHLDGGAMFGVVPKVLWNRRYPCNEQNQIALRTDPILLQGYGRNLLVEAGIGEGTKLDERQRRNYGVTEESRVEESLQELGLTLLDIDTVLMTHMHFDHSNGLTMWREGQLVSTFAQAVIHVSAMEWEEMRKPTLRTRGTYLRENWEPIQSQVQTYQREAEICPGLRLIHTGGHSRGHSILRLESGGEVLYHFADLCGTHAHQHVLWVMAYDDYPMDSISAKQHWMAEAKREEAWLSFYHDDFVRALKLNGDGEETARVERVQG